MHFSPQDSRRNALHALLALLAFLILARPYNGLRHDAVLYFGQVLLNSRAPNLAGDVFFIGGSQDAFSIYAPLLASLNAFLGPALTQQAMLLLAWAGLMAAVLALLRSLHADPGIRLWGGLAVAVLATSYGGDWIFGHSEPFLTARSLAEPLALGGLAALLNGRPAAAAALLLGAALFHPLVALPVLVIAACFLAGQDGRWLWLLLSLPAAAFGLALADLPPWRGLLRAYDPYWWALVNGSNRQVLLVNWRAADWLNLALDVCVLCAAWRWAPQPRWRRLMAAVLAATVLLFAATAVGADLLRLQLPTQLQLWRVHWIAHLLAQAVLPWLAWTLWQRGGLWRASAASLGLAVASSQFDAGHAAPALALCLFTTVLAWCVRRQSSPRVTAALASVILLCAVGVTALQAASALEQIGWTRGTHAPGGQVARLLATPPVAGLLFAALLALAARGRASRCAALLFGTLLLAGAFATWDQRSDMALAIDTQPRPLAMFAERIPPHATVYWPGQLAATWALLERPSFYSRQQGAGLLFNHGTALLYGPRHSAFRRIEKASDDCTAGAFLAQDRQALADCEAPARERLEEICEPKEAQAPDYLVVRGHPWPAPLVRWELPTRRDLPATYALYACSQLRPAAAPGVTSQ